MNKCHYKYKYYKYNVHNTMLVGLVPNEGQFPLPTGRDMELLTTGPMCRYATDLLPLLKVMSGPQAKLAKLDQKVTQVFVMF